MADPLQTERLSRASRSLAAWGRWSLAIAIGVGIHLAGFLLIRVPPVPEAVEAPSRPSLHLTWRGADESTAEWLDQWLLLDPAPLFLPTGLNVAVVDSLPPAPAPAAGLFPPYEPSLSFAAAEPPFQGFWVETREQPPAAILDRLRLESGASFGRRDRPLDALPPRGAMVEIRSLESPGTVFRRVVPEADLGGLDLGGWVVAQFVALVDATGAIGAPLLLETSGNEAVDGFFAQYLERNLQVAWRLPPGYYLILAGP
ncbi:MAG: hypothetical protein EA425_02260 [Puniceicoccaceae bacterium]|nr:MAG: hypothetical protein EA425_02260 [Puniceicoccaceae bacterium]